jgi:hypothetical protein
MAVSTKTLESLRSLVFTLAQESMDAGSLDAGSLDAGSLDEVEEVVEAVRQVCGEAVQEVLLKKQTGRHTYKGVSLPCLCGSRARFVAYPKALGQDSLCGDAG